MKEILLLSGWSIFVLGLSTNAQSKIGGSAGGGYQNVIGLSLDLDSTYVTGAGVGFKHFFSTHDAAEFNLLHSRWFWERSALCFSRN